MKPETMADLRALIVTKRDALPKAVLRPGEVLHVQEDTGALLTEVQRGSLRGQSAALSWVLYHLDALLDAVSPVAATLALADVAEKVRALPDWPGPDFKEPAAVDRAAVLALLEESR